MIIKQTPNILRTHIEKFCEMTINSFFYKNTAEISKQNFPEFLIDDDIIVMTPQKERPHSEKKFKHITKRLYLMTISLKDEVIWWKVLENIYFLAGLCHNFIHNIKNISFDTNIGLFQLTIILRG